MAYPMDSVANYYTPSKGQLTALPELQNYQPHQSCGGWSGGAIVLDRRPVPGRPTIWMIVGQGRIALGVGKGGVLVGHFYSPLSFLSSFSLFLGDGPI